MYRAFSLAGLMPVVLVAVTHSSYWALGTRSVTVQCVSFTFTLLTEKASTDLNVAKCVRSKSGLRMALTVDGVIIQWERRAVSMMYQVAHRCRLLACPPALVCSRARSTPRCRQRTGSSTHAETSGWQSWLSEDWSLGQMGLTERGLKLRFNIVLNINADRPSTFPLQSSRMKLLIIHIILYSPPCLLTPPIKEYLYLRFSAQISSLL